MNASNQISAAVFSAFVKCPTKAHLLAIGEPAPGAFFVDIEARISSMYKPVAKRQLHSGAKVAEFLEFGQLWRSLDYGTIPHDVDCETVVYDFALPQRRLKAANRRNHRHPAPLSPSCFYPGTSRAFPTTCSFVLVRSRCRRPPGSLADTGTLIYGDGYRHRSCEDRGPRRPDAPDHRRDRGYLQQPGTATACPEQALRRLRLPAKVSRSRHRT